MVARMSSVSSSTNAVRHSNRGGYGHERSDEKTYGQFQALSRNLEEEFGQVKAATPAYFDVNVKSLADTQDYLGQQGTASRDPDALRQEFYGFKPAQERFRQWEGQSLPYYRKYKAPDSGRGKKAEGLDGLGFKDSSPKAVGAGITGLGTVAVLGVRGDARLLYPAIPRRWQSAPSRENGTERVVIVVRGRTQGRRL